MQTYDIRIEDNRMESTQHGTFEFPLAIYTTRINSNILGFIDWHWHQELQFCIVREGTVHFKVNGDSIFLSKGEGIFINKGQLHRAENTESRNGEYICFDFHENLISSFTGSIINTRYVQPYTENKAIQHCVLKTSVDWQKRILKNLETAYDSYLKQGIGYEIRLHILLLEVWADLMENHFEKYPSDSEKILDNEDLKKAMDYIHKNYMTKIGLGDLSEEVNLSKSSFSRKFKKQMNCTVFDYIINYRISRAASLLISTDRTVADIAYSCGFGSTSYFIEKFRMKTGKSPLRYRLSAFSS